MLAQSVRLLAPGLFIVFFVFWLANLGLVIWAVVDAAMKPESAWRAADQNKVVWIIVPWIVPVIGALVYLIAIRPKVRAAQANAAPWTPPPPGFPPAP
jgi:phospholipase D-like protein